MTDGRLSVLHHIRAYAKNSAGIEFLASILKGKTGTLDLLYVEEILEDIEDDSRRDLAEEQKPEKDKPSAEKLLSNTETSMSELLPEFNLNSIYTSGDPAEEVLKFGRREDYDLLSLKAYGKGGFKKSILGAHGNKIVKASTMPTLVHKGKLDSSERLLIHVPNNKKRCTNLVSYLANLFDGSKPAITFLVILSEEGEKFEGYTSGEEEFLEESLENYAREEYSYLDIAQEIISERGMDADVRYRTGEITEEILTEAREGRYDLLAFSPEKQNILTSLWSGDKSLKVIRDIEVSVLKFPST